MSTLALCLLCAAGVALFTVAFLGGCAAIERRDRGREDAEAERFLRDRANRAPEDHAA